MNSITDLFQRENEYYDGQHAPGFVQGTVVENNNAEYKGMVKVEFNQPKKGISSWAMTYSEVASTWLSSTPLSVVESSHRKEEDSSTVTKKSALSRQSRV